MPLLFSQLHAKHDYIDLMDWADTFALRSKVGRIHTTLQLADSHLSSRDQLASTNGPSHRRGRLDREAIVRQSIVKMKSGAA